VGRRGAATRAAIPPAVLAALESGTAETATLVEGLAIDFATLLARAVPQAGPDAAARMRAAAGLGVTRRMALAGAVLHERLGPSGADALQGHSSDTVRGWAAYALAAAPGLSLSERLARVQPLADDPHFAVREWAWLALRPHVAADVPAAIRLLTPWTASPSERLRRFAPEATRPRGVWSAHIGPLVQAPARGLPILEPLRADPARYVQDSVGNWLNDAAKSRPAWVGDVCARWLAESPGAVTARVCARGLRSLR
jgi:3-methyladenine DNA glycosylase AlkC